jgi:hypothetical protein
LSTGGGPVYQVQAHQRFRGRSLRHGGVALLATPPPAGGTACARSLSGIIGSMPNCLTTWRPCSCLRASRVDASAAGTAVQAGRPAQHFAGLLTQPSNTILTSGALEVTFYEGQTEAVLGVGCDRHSPTGSQAPNRDGRRRGRCQPGGNRLEPAASGRRPHVCRTVGLVPMLAMVLKPVCDDCGGCSRSGLASVLKAA